MVKDPSDRNTGNPLPPLHGLLFSINSNGSYHGLCYTDRGGLAKTRNRAIGPPWRIDLKNHRTIIMLNLAAIFNKLWQPFRFASGSKIKQYLFSGLFMHCIFHLECHRKLVLNFDLWRTFWKYRTSVYVLFFSSTNWLYFTCEVVGA